MLAAVCLLYLLLRGVEDKGKRYAYVIVSWVTYMYVMTEILSLPKILNRSAIFLGWIIFDVILAVILLCRLKQGRIALQWNLKNVILLLKSYPLHVLACIVTFLWALGTIPYNWDSMTYHLPRIAHWAQNQSVAHFATNNIRQVASPALASFVNLQVYILSGKKDLLLNMLQWSCYVTNAWMIEKLAKKIGCSSKWAKTASLLFLSMPIAFAEALTTQVDHFASLWILIFAYFILDFILQKECISYNRQNVITCVMMSACVVYGYLAKPTVSVGMLLMAAGLLVVCIKRKNPVIHLVRLLVIVIPVIAIFISPEIIRNFVSFQAVNPPNVGARQIVGTLQPAYLFINFMKNFTFNLPNIYIFRSDRVVYSLIKGLAQCLGVELDHPSISEDGKAYLVHAAQTFGHDTAVNPVILILAVLALIWCIYRQIKHKQKAAELTYFTFGIFFVFCGIVRWEPFVSRYMLPYLALLCPIIARQFQDIQENSNIESVRNVILPIVYLVCSVDLFAMTWFHGGIMKGGWSDRYYVNRVEVAEEYQEVVDDISGSGVKSVGLQLMTDDYEYPLWIMARNDVQLFHVNVENETDQYTSEFAIPDCILSTYGLSEELEFGGERYRLAGKSLDNMYIWEYILEK